jgi:hypothetical protein
MITTFDDMPGWRFELREISAGGYKITVHDPNGGLRFSVDGTDPDALIADGRQWVSQHTICPN